MPEPIGRGQRYLPGLDGLRAIAVLAVIAYHLQLGWASGGLLGVGVFFTLSGYLITDLLLGEWRSWGGLSLTDFWSRRARRLLPALFVMLAAVTVWVQLSRPAQMPTLRGNLGAALLYISNWWLIFHHVSYFAQFGPPSPLGHLWSLAVEEQFYLVWPLLLLLGLRRSRGLRRRRPMIVTVLVLSAASAAAMALLYHPGQDPTRVYDGTDTRAFELLLGAALALAWPSSRARYRSRGTVWLLDLAGLAGLAGIGVLIWHTSQSSSSLYRGGMVLLTVATGLVIAAVVLPESRVGRVLGWTPLRWIGVRSYGIYLWHYPVIVLTTPSTQHGFNPWRAFLQVVATLAAAALSWRFVEEPIRHGLLGRLGKRLQPLSRDTGGRLVPSGSAAALLVLTVTIAGLAAGAIISSAGGSPGNGGGVADPLPRMVHSSGTGGRAGHRTPATTVDRSQDARSPSPSAGPAPDTRTSCQDVVHIGDSTSDGLISSSYLPDPHQRMRAQYARVGVRHSYFEISGARSIVETYENFPNAYTVAKRVLATGYRGCWVLALGTNDTADVYVGSHFGLMSRIERMMNLIGNQPVMWVNVKSLLSSGPYSEANMLAWDRTLLRACSRYPNMRVFNWASLARPQWFVSDGVHYTTPGYRARARDIANGLAAAFPAAGERQPASCQVR
jgi:peptidoglycan/LPS O-acetylase OafA/YrhL